MKCKCKYYIMNSEGIRVCSVCGEPSPNQSGIEDKSLTSHKTKAPLYVSAKDKAKAEVNHGS